MGCKSALDGREADCQTDQSLDHQDLQSSSRVLRPQWERPSELSHRDYWTNRVQLRHLSVSCRIHGPLVTARSASRYADLPLSVSLEESDSVWPVSSAIRVLDSLVPRDSVSRASVPVRSSESVLANSIQTLWKMA